MIEIKHKVFIIVFIAIVTCLLGNNFGKAVFADNKESVNSNKETIYKVLGNDEKKADRTIIIGDDKDYPPYSFIDQNGNPTGFDVELAKAAAEAMGFKVKIKLSVWSEAMDELENGKIDVIAGMFYSKDREKFYSFTTKTAITGADVFTRKGESIKNINQLRGKTVVVESDEISGEYLKKQNLGINFVKVHSSEEALKLISMNKYDYAVVSTIIGHYFMKKDKISNIKGNGLVINPDDYCIAVKKGNEDLLFALNGGLQILKATGKYDEIYNKWLGVYEEKTFYQTVIEYRSLIMASVASILLLLLWNRTLKKRVVVRTKELLEANDALNKSKQELLVSNEEIEASYNELAAIEEELRSQYYRLMKSEENLKKSEERNRAIVTAIPDIIFVVDGNAVFKDCQIKDASVLIMPENEFIGKTLWNVLPSKIAETGFEKIKAALKNNSLESFQYEIDTPVGKKYYELRIVKCRENEVIVISRDITDERKNQKKIEFLSYNDQLTGLYNRRFFEEEIERLNSKENLPLTIVMADVNGLKLINDSFGHAAGDELLKKVSAVMLNVCSDKGIISRIGGDEFVILLPKTNELEAGKILKRISELASKEKVESINLSISFGFDTKHYDDENVFEVLKKAEDFMYKKKLFESPSMRGKTIGAIINTLHEKNKREEQHSHRVSEYCNLLGKAMNLPEGEIQELKTVGFLHDIGKVAIDENILNKPGKLIDEEWEKIKRHPEIGYRILSSVNDMAEMSEYVLAHHERWDGKGYPKGLKGEEIPLKSRIIAIADAFDAMTSERAYRSALSKEIAVEELIKNAGIQFDPELVKIFVEKVV
ncbi:HD domain-containing phosphohydrolase [Clostridium ljungdahlii]|uniref:Cyclic di-GMP phosphodiesterase response regulator RpfG n=1 Tax=Clostridium ljungdahlii (strain ATCC 55383 / DSM 13528 / PETC) TaxID=748727 RepID=D8GSY2_CLOLD|nr:transporter substrate-binding domain-containing protein [Clostridium ljungdahlii]ADK14552.1 putative transport/signal transduction system protein [Clostridium ljungdahlii DSM 13528]OAA88031.1 Cyclic di-GMP phosphodiesterase response regulator RpfG [Clostridium ljungdahlii DSM 13528]